MKSPPHSRRLTVTRWLPGALLALPLLLPVNAHASMFKGETLDKVADVMTWVVLILAPIVGIVVFLLIHILPEKIAEKKQHPQVKAIQCLCLLSLVFGGLLWPIAWLWAYTRPIGYKMAYGTEKHEDFFIEQGHRLKAGKLDRYEIEHLRAELDAMAARGTLPPPLRQLRADLDALPPQMAATATVAQG
jgi:hypothetical protein